MLPVLAARPPRRSVYEKDDYNAVAAGWLYWGRDRCSVFASKLVWICCMPSPIGGLMMTRRRAC